MVDVIDKWFGGENETDADEEIDPELRELAGYRPEGSVLRPVIFVAVMALGLWIYMDWRPELRYFWSEWEPVDVGDMTTEFPHDEVGEPTEPGESVLPHNRFVRLRGITEPGIEPEGGGYTFYMIRGAPVYVMMPDDSGQSTREEMMNEAKRMTLADLQDAGQSREIDTTGRLIDMSRMPNRFEGFKKFFKEKFGVEFCSMYSASELQRRKERRREIVREQLRMAYEEASPEEREQRGLKSAPTESQIDRAMKDEKICEQAYLFRAGQTPKSFWWYAALLGLYGLFMALNGWWLIKWIRAFAQRD